MTPEEILSHPPVVLSDQQRRFYFDKGYLLVERVVPDEWVERLIAVTGEMVDRSRSLEQSDAIFDLEPGHTAGDRRLRRLTSPVEHHPAYWEFASQSIIADIAADLVGPDVKFHHSKLNFKWARGGEEVKWHQDITYWPHTNYSPLTIGTYLHDVGDDQGPLGAIGGSHNGRLYNQYSNGNWVGCLSEEDAAGIDTEGVEYLTGQAGSVTIHNCRVIHGSRPNLSDQGRAAAAQRLLLRRCLHLYRHTRCRAATKGRSCAAGRRCGRTTTGVPAWCRPTGRVATPRSTRCSSRRSGTRSSSRRFRSRAGRCARGTEPVGCLTDAANHRCYSPCSHRRLRSGSR